MVCLDFQLWTDGSYGTHLGGGGRGGWAAILVHGSPGRTKLLLRGWEEQTTSNRMELTAVTRGLAAVGAERSNVIVYTDSAYVKNAFTHGWIEGWVRDGWISSRGDPVANQDLWRDLIGAVRRHNVKWVKVRGHAAQMSLNHMADAMAVTARRERIEETKLL